jgi:hypothetical protein
MTDYTKATNFASKDSLASGNALKIVKGTEIDTEFNSISTAIATKTDNASAAITGGSIAGITDLAVADGGTGASTAANARTNLGAAASGANSDITSITGLTTPLTVAQGGIGAATLTANYVLLGNGTSAPQTVAPSTSGNVLTSNGTTWQSTASNGGVTSVNSVTGAVSTVALYDIGSFIFGRPANATNYAVNSTIAGSSLYAVSNNCHYYNPTSTWNSFTTGAPTQTLVNTGSWRCVSPAGGDSTWGEAGLWVRYA